MAKPIIYFKGARFKTGSTEGYRPQLVAAEKVKDAALAEELCIETGLSMSPTELLHAIQMTLEAAPRLVATDGRVREFTNLLTWNRSASGRLTGVAGAWNDSCSAKVLVQLKKNSKQLIDATFRNELELPVPKLDNVTWVGASGVTNVVKVGSQFAAYGRNMQMMSGDTAELIMPNLVEKTLTCVSSDVSHAVFSWPSDCAPEEGARITFVMTSRGGSAEQTPTTSTKEVVVIPADAPIITRLTDDATIAGDHLSKTANSLHVIGNNFDYGGMTPIVQFMAKKNAGDEWETFPAAMVGAQSDTQIDVTLMATMQEMGYNFLKVSVSTPMGTANREVEASA